MERPDDLLEALLTAHVITTARWLFSMSTVASVPQWVEVSRDENSQTLEDRNPNRRKTWDECLVEAVDDITENRPEVMRLFRERGLLK